MPYPEPEFLNAYNDPDCGGTIDDAVEPGQNYGIWHVEAAPGDLDTDPQKFLHKSPIYMRILMNDPEFVPLEGALYNWDGQWLIFASGLITTDLGVVTYAGDYIKVPLLNQTKTYTMQAKQLVEGEFTEITQCSITVSIADSASVSLDRLRLRFGGE